VPATKRAKLAQPKFCNGYKKDEWQTMALQLTYRNFMGNKNIFSVAFFEPWL